MISVPFTSTSSKNTLIFYEIGMSFVFLGRFCRFCQSNVVSASSQREQPKDKDSSVLRGNDQNHQSVLDNADASITLNFYRVVGFCKINYGSTVGVFEYLIVSEDYRGNGYGAQLMDWALNRFEELGIRDIDVKVADGDDAIFLYEKYGFKMNAHILRLSR